MLQNASECTRTHHSAAEWLILLQMWQNASERFRKLHDAPDCLRMLQNDLKSFTILQIVSELQKASECFRKHRKASECFTRLQNAAECLADQPASQPDFRMHEVALQSFKMLQNALLYFRWPQNNASARMRMHPTLPEYFIMLNLPSEASGRKVIVF